MKQNFYNTYKYENIYASIPIGTYHRDATYARYIISSKFFDWEINARNMLTVYAVHEKYKECNAKKKLILDLDL